jgi:hypothetical protein
MTLAEDNIRVLRDSELYDMQRAAKIEHSCYGFAAVAAGALAFSILSISARMFASW